MRFRSSRALVVFVSMALFAPAACSSSGDDGGGGGSSSDDDDSGSGGGGQSGRGSGGSGATGGRGGGSGAGTGGSAGASGGAGQPGGGGAGGGGGKGGTGGAAGSATNMDGGAMDAGTKNDGAAAGGTPVFVAISDNGRYIRSLDLGKTWTDAGTLNDSLDRITFGKGLFVVGTHTAKIYWSTDGKNWEGVVPKLGQWVGGLAFGKNVFVGVGGYGSSWYSNDGKMWSDSPTFREGGEAARSLAFGNDMFVAATDTGNWWTSIDGKTWTKAGGGHKPSEVVFCGNAFADRSACTNQPAGRGQSSVEGSGVWVAITSGAVERSEDGGKTWQKVAGAGKDLTAVGFGLLP